MISSLYFSPKGAANTGMSVPTPPQHDCDKDQDDRGDTGAEPSQFLDGPRHQTQCDLVRTSTVIDRDEATIIGRPGRKSAAGRGGDRLPAGIIELCDDSGAGRRGVDRKGDVAWAPAGNLHPSGTVRRDDLSDRRNFGIEPGATAPQREYVCREGIACRERAEQAIIRTIGDPLAPQHRVEVKNAKTNGADISRDCHCRESSDRCSQEPPLTKAPGQLRDHRSNKPRQADIDHAVEPPSELERLQHRKKVPDRPRQAGHKHHRRRTNEKKSRFERAEFSRLQIPEHNSHAGERDRVRCEQQINEENQLWRPNVEYQNYAPRGRHVHV
jgi:hypothetical protein